MCRMDLELSVSGKDSLSLSSPMLLLYPVSTTPSGKTKYCAFSVCHPNELSRNLTLRM